MPDEVLEPEVVEGRFQPGKSGNPRGRPKKGDALAEKVREALDQIHYIEREAAAKQNREPRKSIDAIIDRQIVKAMIGDQKAAEWLASRGWGKAPQKIDVGGEVDHKHQLEVGPQARLLMDRIDALRNTRELNAKPEPDEPVEGTSPGRPRPDRG